MLIYRRDKFLDSNSYDRNYAVTYGQGLYSNFKEYITRGFLNYFIQIQRKPLVNSISSPVYLASSKYEKAFMVTRHLNYHGQPLYKNDHDYYILIANRLPMSISNKNYPVCLQRINNASLKMIAKFRFKLGSYYQWRYKYTS